MQGLSTASMEKQYLPARKKKKQTRKPKRGRSPKLNMLTGPGPFPECLEFLRVLSLNAFQTGSPPAKLLCPSPGRGDVSSSQPRRGVPARGASHWNHSTRQQQVCATQAEVDLGPGWADGTWQDSLPPLLCSQVKLTWCHLATHWIYHISTSHYRHAQAAK